MSERGLALNYRDFIAGVILWQVLSIFSICEGAENSFYSNVKLSYLLNRYNEDIPDHIIAGKELKGDFYIEVGNLTKWERTNLDLSLYIRNKQTGGVETIIHNANIVYMGDRYRWEIGKDMTIWGNGTFFYPTYYLEVLDELKEEQYFPLPQEIYIWQGLLSFYKGESTYNLGVYIDDDLIEQGREPKWYSFRFWNESFINNTEMRLQLAHLFNNNNHRLMTGIEGVYTGIPDSTITLAGNAEYSIDRGDVKFKWVLGISHFFPSGLSIGNEVFYKEGLFNGLFVALAPPQGSRFDSIAISEMILFDFEGRSYTNQILINHALGSGIKHSLGIHFFNGDEGSTFSGNFVKWKFQYLITTKF